jgi:hypothetical protein
MTPQMSDSITIGQSLTSTSNNNLPVDNDQDQQRNPVSQHIDVKVPFANNNNNNSNNQRGESSMNFGSVENVDSSHDPVTASGKNLSESIVNVSFENFTATAENSLQSLGQNNHKDGDGTQTELDVALNTDINASMFKDMMNLDPFDNMNNKDYENQTGDNKGSRLPSKYTSRTNSREGGNRIREIKQLKGDGSIPPNFVLEDPQLFDNPNRPRRPETPDSHPPTGPISRQQSLKLTKDRSFRDELSNGLRNRLRGMSNTDLNNNNNRMFLENTPEHQHLETMIDTIYSSIAKNGMEPKDWNLIQIATPAPTKGMKSDQSTSTEDLEELLNTQLYELPIFDNQDNILVVKSYKPTVEGISFEQQLMKSQNPLFFIYQKYSSYLSHLQKERLFYASLLSTTMPMHPFNAIQQQPTNSSSPMKPSAPGKMMIYPADSILVQRNRRHIYAAAHQILLTAQRLKEECYNALPIVDAIETVINDSVQIVKAVRRSEDIPSHQYLVNSLSDCYR